MEVRQNMSQPIKSGGTFKETLERRSSSLKRYLTFDPWNVLFAFFVCLGSTIFRGMFLGFDSHGPWTGLMRHFWLCEEGFVRLFVRLFVCLFVCHPMFVHPFVCLFFEGMRCGF